MTATKRHKKHKRVSVTLLCFLCLFVATNSQAQVLGDPVDVSQDFQKMENVYFVGSRVTSFDTATGQGTLQWDRYLRSTTLSFNKIDVGFARGKATEFPGTEYDQDPALPFAISFVTPRTVRLRFSTRGVPLNDNQSLMLAGPVVKDTSWRGTSTIFIHCVTTRRWLRSRKKSLATM